MITQSPFVSVIIPVFNDAKRLKICLEALENQFYPKNLYEVIVVDNASDTKENIAKVVAQFSQAFYAYESLPGSYAARNKGISLAKGVVIAFTDADCIPVQDWIEKGVKHLLQTPGCGLVAGKIEIFFKAREQATPVELYESITAFPQKQLLEKRRFGATANLFTFRSVLDKVGFFDTQLKSNGDVHWGQRVFAHSYKQVYADDACVYHPARHSWRQLYKRTIRMAGGAYDLQNRKENSFIQRNLRFLINLSTDLVPPLIFVINAFFDSRLQGFEKKIQVCIVMFFVRYISAWEKLRLKAGATSARE
ncbi:glycosyltransferase [Scytonema sp. UIC 10036]|uniref:glycosyltransferase n=1 Tax=Scytonema sp. UIC 10036 TaxID=2304196 RepID=UPI0012DA6FBD|nr:glycosyltransferase [Scytonema sp. UIC 10036]MUG93844.1 glycosyltransferase [Scytonema sp. UIC 10036]